MPVSPHDAAVDLLDRASALLSLDKASTATDVREDLRRMAWAMGVAAIDTYVHWSIRRIDLGQPLPKGLRKLAVNFGDLVDLGNESVAARREDRAIRPQTRARNVMNEVLLTKTFQSADAVKTGLEMCGATDVWNKLAAAMNPVESKQAIIDHLNALAHRRNMIVHEGDLARLIRPQRIKRTALTASDVQAELAWIRRFADAMRVVAP